MLLLISNVVSAQQQSGSVSTSGGVASAPGQKRSAGDASATNPRALGSITGRVLNESGQPLVNAGVYVRAINSTNPPRTVSTNVDGKFQIDNLDPGAYTVWGAMPGYVNVPGNTPSYSTEIGARNYYKLGDSVTLNMVKGGVITGTVVNSIGEPVIAVGVRAIRVRDAEGRSLRASLGATRERLTDDRGIYRLYGLEPGTYLIAAGGSGQLYRWLGLYDSDAPTYAPSATRDTAAEVAVRSGEETASVDIRYRGDQGHAISGTVGGMLQTKPDYWVSITLTHAASGVVEATSFLNRRADDNSFALYGVPDGEYDLTAGSSSGSREGVMTSPTRRVVVKGADVTGVELMLAPLGSISGRLIIETGREVERKENCEAARKPLPEETVIIIRRDEKNAPKNQTSSGLSPISEIASNSEGVFTAYGLVAGNYHLQTRLPAEDWYVRSITLKPKAAARGASRGASVATQPSAAVTLNTLTLKSGERATGVTITIVGGAASLRGRVVAATEGAARPTRLRRVHLVPVEREFADDPLRFAETFINNDGTFALTNLAPGRYYLLARAVPQIESTGTVAPPVAWDTESRAALRREAESANLALDLQSCQRIADYVLRYALPISTTKPKS